MNITKSQKTTVRLFKKLLPFIAVTVCFSQVRIGEWKALTSPLNVRDILASNGEWFAATEGGLFKISQEETRTFTTVEGLKSVDLSALAIDQNNHIWMGGSSPNGFVQIFDPKKIQSIANFDFGLTEIFDIQVMDSMAWIFYLDGQDPGIMKFLYTDKWEYRDSFRNFPLEAGSINCFTATDSTLIVGTDHGIYVGDISDNLKDPNNWIPLNSNLTLEITALSLNGSILAFSSATTLYEYSFETQDWNEIPFGFTLNNVSEIHADGNFYWVIDQKKLYKISDDTGVLLDNRFWLSGWAKSNTETVVGTRNGILFIQKQTDGSEKVSRYLANAPVTSGFSAITVLDDGRLVGGSSKGISIYSDEGWRNIIQIIQTNTDTIHESYDYSTFIGDTIFYNFGGYIADLEQGPDGLLYCAIRGAYHQTFNEPIRKSGGVIIIDVDDPTNVTLIDTTHLSYFSTTQNPRPYMIVMDIEFDPNGNLWIANPYCINGNMPIHVRSQQDEWKHYGSYETPLRISQTPGSIAFDDWGRTWYSAFHASEANLGIYPDGGIFMLDFEGDPFNPGYFTWTKVQDDGTVWSLGMGLNNRIYYLTPTGLNYFDLNDSPSPVSRENPYAFFPNISFGSGAEIKMDPHGNVWTHSPSQGIHVLLENTTYWPDIDGFRADNSPLLSDEITDIAFDEKRNLAYIATSKGVNILRIPFGTEKLTTSDVKVFPSPFYIPTNKPLKVDGLPYESAMMVMTLDGKVVRHVPSQGTSIDGDQLSWNGRDNAGDYVSSGVYLLAIYGLDGSQTVEKITVIKN